MKHAFVILAVTTIAAVSLASTGPCDLSVTYFPPGLEDSNFPNGWHQTNQKQAGNNATDHLLKIVLAPYPEPTLQVWPVHYLLNNETEVPSSCWVAQAATGTAGSRRLQQSSSSGAFVLTPASYKVEYTLRNETFVAGISPNGSVTSPPLSVKVNNFGDHIPDGEYCIDIYVTILAKTAAVRTALNTTLTKLPTSDLRLHKRVCFVKLSVRPRANFATYSCNPNGTFSFQLSGITPLPIYPQPAPPSSQGKMLTKTVFRVWGNIISTFPNQPDQSNTQENCLAEYLVLDTNTSNSLSFSTTSLQEGMYTFGVEGSITTDIQELVSVAGKDNYTDGALSGQVKYMGGLMQNGNSTMWQVGVQHRASSIDYVSGPAGSLSIGDVATFQWDHEGYGSFLCYVDGQLVSNLGGQYCESPLGLKLLDAANHTLDIVMVDACSNKLTKSVGFGEWGWALNTTGEVQSGAEVGMNAATSRSTSSTVSSTTVARLNVSSTQSAAGRVVGAVWCWLMAVMVALLGWL